MSVLEKERTVPLCPATKSLEIWLRQKPKLVEQGLCFAEMTRAIYSTLIFLTQLIPKFQLIQNIFVHDFSATLQCTGAKLAERKFSICMIPVYFEKRNSKRLRSR